MITGELKTEPTIYGMFLMQQKADEQPNGNAVINGAQDCQGFPSR